jgi:PemK-like, MazF-like toxin of type II toxin-antitoxin system
MSNVIGRFGASLRKALSKGLGSTSSSRRSSKSTPSEAAAGGAPTARREPGRVTIEYSPDLDGDADPGEVVWTWVPYEDDPTQGKDRPVVIIGRAGRGLAGVPLTSKDHDRADEIPVGTGAWDRSGRPSFAKVDQLITVDPKAVRREGSALSRSHFDDVVTAVGRYHDVRLP